MAGEGAGEQDLRTLSTAKFPSSSSGCDLQ